MATHIPEELKALWESNGLPEDYLAHLELTGDPDTAAPSSFSVVKAAQISVALAGLSAAYLHYLQTGTSQRVTVDARHAALSFRSEAWYTINGKVTYEDAWDSIAGLYKTKDGGYVRIHTNFPHHRQGILSILGITDDPSLSRDAVAQALMQWTSLEFEDECAKSGMCVTAVRSFEEWERHPQAKALKDVPPVLVRKIGEASKRHPNITTKRPLSGIRVLDLSRVLAGPIAGRALAAHGASVLLITSPSLPSLLHLDIETSLGKRTTQLDLNAPSDHKKLEALAQDADVFLQAYRPGGLENRGFGTADLMKMRQGRGIVCANLTAWGWEGPWRDRKGFDSLVQTATGFNVDEGIAYATIMKSEEGGGRPAPRPLPMQALDQAAAYLLAFGINVALCRSLTEGGSYEVQASLAAVGQWIRSLGRVSASRGFAFATPFPSRLTILNPSNELELDKLSVDWQQSHGRGGRIRALRHAAVLDKTPVREGGEEGEAPMRLDADEAVWI